MYKIEFKYIAPELLVLEPKKVITQEFISAKGT